MSIGWVKNFFVGCGRYKNHPLLRVVLTITLYYMRARFFARAVFARLFFARILFLYAFEDLGIGDDGVKYGQNSLVFVELSVELE